MLRCHLRRNPVIVLFSFATKFEKSVHGLFAIASRRWKSQDLFCGLTATWHHCLYFIWTQRHRSLTSVVNTTVSRTDRCFCEISLFLADSVQRNLEKWYHTVSKIIALVQFWDNTETKFFCHLTHSVCWDRYKLSTTLHTIDGYSIFMKFQYFRRYSLDQITFKF